MELREFLDGSYTAFHAVKNAEEYLNKKGFSKLDMGKEWKLSSGGKYYVVRNGSALVAFSVGSLETYTFNIAESHTDSPCLKIKGNALIDSPEGKKLNVERYGGLILYSMMDIPLKIAGRIVKKTDGGVEISLTESDFYVNIPSLAIHHNPDVNGGFAFNAQVDMCPLIGECDGAYSIFGDDIIDADLFVVPAVKSFYGGKNGEYLISPRIDNLTSVYASLKGIAECNPKGVAVAAIFDNEEIGSLTKQGAQSALLSEILAKINAALGFGEEEFLRAKNNGMILSVDNGHAVHQSHGEKNDPVQKAVLDGGIVIKHHVNYSTDGLSSSILKRILDKAEIKYQDYYNRSDLRCGSTLGLMSSAQLNMDACDIGIAQLAMHSAIETASKYDVERMESALRAFFDASIEKKDGCVAIK